MSDAETVFAILVVPAVVGAHVMGYRLVGWLCGLRRPVKS